MSSGPDEDVTKSPFSLFGKFPGAAATSEADFVSNQVAGGELGSRCGSLKVCAAEVGGEIILLLILSPLCPSPPCSCFASYLMSSIQGGQMDDKEISQLRALMSFQHTFTVCCFTTADPQLASRLVSFRLFNRSYWYF